MSNEPQSQVSFEDPPDLPQFDWAAIAEQLRARPREWAKIYDRERTSLSEAIRQNSIAALRPIDGFEVRTRNNKRGVDEEGRATRTCSLYLRYVPPTPPKKKGRK